MTTTEAQKLTVQRILEATVEKVYRACIDEKAITYF